METFPNHVSYRYHSKGFISHCRSIISLKDDLRNDSKAKYDFINTADDKRILNGIVTVFAGFV